MYEPPRFMSPQTAFQQILLPESSRHPTSSSPPARPSATERMSTESPSPNASADHSATECATAQNAIASTSLLPPDRTLAMSLSRIGTPTQRIIAGTLTELASLPVEDFGDPLHSIVIVGKRLHPLELEYAGRWCVHGERGDWWRVGREVYGVVREGGH